MHCKLSDFFGEWKTQLSVFKRLISSGLSYPPLLQSCKIQKASADHTITYHAIAIE